MAELFGAIERGLGAALSAFYDAIPNFGIAIVLLTLAVRTLLIPVTIKQIRGMAATQKLQPDMQKIRQKYKVLQQKAKDRAEVQQLRLKMNEEIQQLFKTHGAHPASGCLPLLAQMPFFIALFSIMRAVITIVPTTVALVGGGTVNATLYTDDQLRQTVCRPVEQAAATPGATLVVECLTEDGPSRRFELGGFKDKEQQDVTDASWVTHCSPNKQDNGLGFSCRSALSTGHIPRDSTLFNDLTADEAGFAGMQPGCSASQVGSDAGVRGCTSTQDEGGAAQSLPYYLLVLVIVFTQYYQAKQMADRMRRQGTDIGPAAQSQQMTMKIMPLVIGFFSFTLPAGTNVYLLTTNLWTIVQQHIVFSRQDHAQAAEDKEGPREKPSKKAAPAALIDPDGPPPMKSPGPKQPNPNASKKKKKKRR